MASKDEARMFAADFGRGRRGDFTGINFSLVTSKFVVYFANKPADEYIAAVFVSLDLTTTLVGHSMDHGYGSSSVPIRADYFEDKENDETLIFTCHHLPGGVGGINFDFFVPGEYMAKFQDS